MLENKYITALPLLFFVGAISGMAYADSGTYDWSGLYIGANIGTSHARINGTTSTIDPNSPIGGGRGSDSGSDQWNGSIVGVQLGYNWMLNKNILLGVEGDFSAPNLSHDTNGVSKFGVSDKTFNVDTIGMLRGRVGYASNNWLIFGTGGAAWTHVRTSNTQGPCGDGGTPPNYSIANCSSGPFTGVPYGTKDNSSINKTGWTIGAGAEVGITQNWTTRLEYIYTDFGSLHFSNPSFNRESTFKLKTNSLQIGFNYKF